METIKIGDRLIGPDQPCFIIAEMSANHNNDFDKAKQLIKLAKENGADAIKLQTYTADTITLNCDNNFFQISSGPWQGKALYQLYKQAYTPWEWQAELKSYADEIGVLLFSTPFDKSAVDFLESLNVPAYKIASFEIVDIPLIEYIAKTKKPIILSTGMASLADIELAVNTIKSSGNNQIVLLKCTSEYPAMLEDMNLRSIASLSSIFSTPAGLSDHSLHSEISISAVSLGACVIEKHFIQQRSEGGPDSSFSIEPLELKLLVESIRNLEKALGSKSQFGITKGEESSIVFRKSIFVSNNISKGDFFTTENVRCVRPGYGLHPKYYSQIIGKKANQDLTLGTPFNFSFIQAEK